MRKPYKKMTGERKSRWQQTFNVGGHKITVIIKERTSMGNFIGFAAEVYDNEERQMKIPMIRVLSQNEAQEKAYVKFIKAL